MPKLIMKDGRKLNKEPQYELIKKVIVLSHSVTTEVLIEGNKYKRMEGDRFISFTKIQEPPKSMKRTECSCEWTKQRQWRKDGLRLADTWTRKYIGECPFHSK